VQLHLLLQVGQLNLRLLHFEEQVLDMETHLRLELHLGLLLRHQKVLKSNRVILFRA